MKILPNIQLGEMVLEELLSPMGLSQNALASAATPHQ
jgi:plasmid maintenance system antidote protein VapI